MYNYWNASCYTKNVTQAKEAGLLSSKLEGVRHATFLPYARYVLLTITILWMPVVFSVTKCQQFFNNENFIHVRTCRSLAM